MNLWEIFQNIDRRVWYVLLLVSLFIPLVRPLGLPLSIGGEARDVYNTIEALPAGSVVIVSPSYSPGTDAEMWPQHAAVMQHLMRKGCKIIQVSLALESVMYAVRAIEAYAPKYNYKMGVDHVIMPYKAGLDVVIASMGRDIHALYTEDYYGTLTSQLPLMQSISGIQDIALVVDFMPGNTLVDYIKQIGSVYNTPITGGVTGVCIPTMMPYVMSGQCRGLLGGMRGAAEYELLINSPGSAIGGMDAQSLSHLLIIVAIALGNIGLVAGRGLRKGGGGK
ncbi:MAG: hypothetical protein Q8P31_06615 [Bacillota bacterium]|nr:hypothetical protein [Bacillota bacterium]